MLNAETRQDIDLHWDACWPTNKLNPLIIVDLVTYLFYVKQLDDYEIEIGHVANTGVFSNQQEALRWSSFSRLDADKMQKLFVKEGGIIEFINHYAAHNHQFSRLLRAPLLMVPTPKMLAHAVGIVSIMAENDRPTQSTIYNYLIQKTATVDNRLITIPEEISQLMISLLNPKRDDVLLDPLVGTGNSLIHGSRFINKNTDAESSLDHSHKTFIGIEPDPVLYRIAALNFFLTGVENSLLKTGQESTEAQYVPNLILGNLLFQEIPKKDTDVLTNEDLFGFIETSLQAGGRATVLLSNAQNNVHKTLLEKHTLEAVISLPKELLKNYDQAKVNLLVFTKAFPREHPSVWFYDTEVGDLDRNENGAGHSPVFTDLLHQWQSLDERRKMGQSKKSFFVPADQIKKYNYDLNIARYQYAIERSKEEAPKESRKKRTGVIVIPPRSVTSTEPAAPIIRTSTPPRPVTAHQQKPIVKKNKTAAIIASLLAAFLLGAAVLYFSTSNAGNGELAASEDTIVKRTSVDELESKVEPQKEREQPSGLTDSARSITPKKETPEKAADQQASVPEAAPIRKIQTEKSPVTPTAAKRAVVKEPVAQQDEKDDTEVKGLYKIIDKAYFHNDADESTRREAFVIHWNNSYATIKALEEKNDFVYTVFKNHLGQTSKGWLRKKDLKPIEE